jgi:Fe(3+) dicitrate transport protein
MLDRQFNAGRVFVYGAELLASERVALPRGYWVEGTATYTYTGSRFRTSFTSDGPQIGDVERGDELPYVPEHLAAIDLGGGGRIWGLHLSGAYVGQMRDVAGRGEISDAELIPRYFVLDATGDVWPTPRVRIYLTVQNLLDRKYMVSRRPFGARPGMPLQLAAGLKYHFG